MAVLKKFWLAIAFAAAALAAAVWQAKKADTPKKK